MYLKQIRKFLAIAILAFVLLLANQIMHVHTLYEHQEMIYSNKVRNWIESLTFDFGMQRTNEKDRCGYDSRTSQITYIFNGQKVIHARIDSSQDIKRLYEQCCYDIRDTSKWKLKDVHKYLLQNLERSDLHPASLQLLLLDSTHNIIDAYPSRRIPKHILASPECDIQLGFLTKDHLYAYCPYPPLLFWHEAGDRVLLAVCLFAIVALCVVVLYKTVKREKLEAHYQELYVHSVVHDLKRPIANQIALQESILPEIPEPYKSIAGQGMEQMQDTLKSINRMLLQSTDAHGLRLKIERFNLQELLQSLSRPEQWRTTRGKRFQIDVDYRAASPWIDGDPNFLHAVFYNLIDNSLKYSGPEVRVAITCADADNRRLRVAFADNGLGISPAALRHIFDRYNRGDHQGDKSVKGHGQGLHYARLVIKAHRGTIDIDSAPAAGTTVTVTLPADIPHSQKQRHHWN